MGDPSAARHLSECSQDALATDDALKAVLQIVNSTTVAGWSARWATRAEIALILSGASTPEPMLVQLATSRSHNHVAGLVGGSG